MDSSDFKDYLTEDELTLVTSRSDLRAAMIVLFDWVVIIGLLLMAGLYPKSAGLSAGDYSTGWPPDGFWCAGT